MPMTNSSSATPSYSYATAEIKATPEYQRAVALEVELAQDFPHLFTTERLACIVEEPYDRAGTPGCACTRCNSAWPADEPEAHERGCAADKSARFLALAEAWESCFFFGWADNYRTAAR